LKYGEIAGNNPWQATGLEWQIQSPPLTENFTTIPIMDHEAYDYEWLENQTLTNQNLENQKAKEVASVG
jgi:cytochrome c oxidase subunit 1